MKSTMRLVLIALSLCVLVGGASASPRKPSAPVDVRLETQPVGGAVYEVTLVVTPRKNVKGLVLQLDGKTLNVGTLGAGKSKTLSTRVTIGPAGKDVVGSALVDVGSHKRRAAASVRLGKAAPPPPPAHIVRLPDGTEAAEVRQ